MVGKMSLPEKMTTPLIVISCTLLLIVTPLLVEQLKPEGEEPLIVKVDGVEYLDEEFDENFNYTLLVGKVVSFHQPFNISELIRRKIEVEYYEFESLEEAWLLLERLKTPNVVIGFAMWLCNGTYEEALERFRRAGGAVPEDGSEFGGFLGQPKGPGVYYMVYRGHPSSQIGGIWIQKRYKTNSGSAAIWSLHIKLDIPPPYPAKLERYPLHARRW